MTTQVAPMSGLSATEVAERIAAGQVNTLPPRSGRTTWDIIKANVFTRINFLLMVLFVIVLRHRQPGQRTVRIPDHHQLRDWCVPGAAGEADAGQPCRGR